MKNEQINIAIAEACGWHTIAFNRGWINAGDSETQTTIPDYCNDLNAMHEAENVVIRPARLWYQYCLNLPFFESIGATARQRAEAFLRTIGKWEEGAK